MGRIRALIWVIWVRSDTWADPDFRSDFLPQCSLTLALSLVLYLSEIFAVILIGSNFVPIGPKTGTQSLMLYQMLTFLDTLNLVYTEYGRMFT